MEWILSCHDSERTPWSVCVCFHTNGCACLMPWQVETWISQQLVRFASTDYGDSVVAAEDLLKAMEETYNPALKKNKVVASAGGVSVPCWLCRVDRRCLRSSLSSQRSSPAYKW